MLYHVVQAHFGGRSTSIVLQNVNGPCPLLAVVNVLLLRGELELAPSQATVTFEELAAMLRALLKSQQAAKELAPEDIDDLELITLDELDEIRYRSLAGWCRRC